jgi:hypothetical protein
MDCCLAVLISDFLSVARYISKVTTTFLAKIEKGEQALGAGEMALISYLFGRRTRRFCIP